MIFMYHKTESTSIRGLSNLLNRHGLHSGCVKLSVLLQKVHHQLEQIGKQPSLNNDCLFFLRFS